MLRGCQNQCLEVSPPRHHHHDKHKIQTFTFVLSKDTNNIAPLVLWTDLIARKLLGETYHFLSRFISRTYWNHIIFDPPHWKVIFKIFSIFWPMRLAGTRSERPEKSAFSERKRPKKGEKVIFKIFQNPMLWGVYPEVLMALAQNSWQIWNSSNRLGDKSLHLCLKEPVRKRSLMFAGFYS